MTNTETTTAKMIDTKGPEYVTTFPVRLAKQVGITLAEVAECIERATGRRVRAEDLGSEPHPVVASLTPDLAMSARGYALGIVEHRAAVERERRIRQAQAEEQDRESW